MRIYDLIETKKRGGALTEEEIAYMVRGFVDGRIPDYQMSAMLMAVCFQKMNTEETTALTLAMADSGDRMDLSSIKGIKVDKHSTGASEIRPPLYWRPLWLRWGSRWQKCPGEGWDTREEPLINWKVYQDFALLYQKKNF